MATGGTSPPPHQQAAASAATQAVDSSYEVMRFSDVWKRISESDTIKSEKPIGRVDLNEFYFWFKQWTAGAVGVALGLLGITGTAGILTFLLVVCGGSAMVFQKLYVYDDVMTLIEAAFSESTMQSGFTFALFWIVTHTIMMTLVY